MQYKSLERRLGLATGAVSTVMNADAGTRYTRFPVSPKRGIIRKPGWTPKKRMILAPSKDLKAIQRAIARHISSKFTAHPIAHAYENGRSIFANARQHVGARSILKIDLVNFFGSIGRQSIIDALRLLLDDFGDRDIEVIADLCCCDGYLPQGSPASPVLSNLVCYPLDVELDRLARRHGCKVTRFSDDITFSTSAEVFPPVLARTWRSGLAHGVALERPICSLLQQRGFEINIGKLMFRTRPMPLKITGLIVTDSLSVPRAFWHNLRASLHNWDRRGLDTCARTHANGCVVAFVNSLRSSIEYIGQVQGRDCKRYQRALAAFEELRSRDKEPLSAAIQRIAAARKAKKAKDENVIIPGTG
ncbi:reverse transcriptase family protein [Sphingopyxis granuli]|uniref:RNA-directed DNA polymerase n=1 Tax=Sphingopyxis granuli TaxID=267128 RepID=A0AA86L4S8_9SPHN|nr:reverse transcriptase family protein [Sphingopyxis granuli]AMG76311.1 RNA-directed DNA polymerase [Sphingopyxis granuli]